MNKAVFLDRDGVLVELIVSSTTGKGVAPKSISELHVFPYVVNSLKKLRNAGYMLFIVSNQPDYARGNTTLEALQAVNGAFEEFMEANGVHFEEYFYCFHHPKGVVPEYSIDCEDRKPKPGFILKAAKKYDLDLSKSWMIGDQEGDIGCGNNAHVKTIEIQYPLSAEWRRDTKPDFKAKDLEEAVKIVLSS